MDCKQRISILLCCALSMCVAESGLLNAQETPRAGNPSVNSPKTISNGQFRQGNSAGALSVPASSETENGSDREPTQPFLIETRVKEPQQVSQKASDVPIPLKPRSEPLAGNSDTISESESSAGGASAGGIFAALVVVLLFVLGLAKLFLRQSPYAIRGLPQEAIDVLGRRAVDPRNSIYMVKVGSRMILLGSSPSGLTSLGEITDPIEIAALANICAAAQQSRPDAAKWLGKLWPKTTSVAESRPFDDQLGEKLFEEAQQSESAQVNSLTVSTGREQYHAG